MINLMYSCEQASKLSSRAMEEPLTPSERVRLHMHLFMCRRCSNFARQIDFLRRASSTFPEFLERDLV